MTIAASDPEGAGRGAAPTLAEVPSRAMLALKGDLADSAVQAAATGIAGVAFPDRGTAIGAGESGILWMAPDEILIMVPRSGASEAMVRARAQLGGRHYLLDDVSGMRRLFRLEGDGTLVRETLAKLSPADLRPARFPPGTYRRTRLAQIPAGLWMRDDTTAEILVFRSVAGYASALLENAVKSGPVRAF